MTRPIGDMGIPISQTEQEQLEKILWEMLVNSPYLPPGKREKLLKEERTKK
jgi:hypothetical protein